VDVAQLTPLWRSAVDSSIRRGRRKLRLWTGRRGTARGRAPHCRRATCGGFRM